ncbi:MAG: type VI secretion system baseplate subunit TssE [Polyangiales bacterium]
MTTRGLLERMAATGASERAGRSDYASILAHLRVLLNTRHGDAESNPDFGIPDFTDYLHNLASGLPMLQTALQDAIARHEPRLTQVTVRVIDTASDSLVLHFEVSGRLASAPDRQLVRFATRVVRGGRVSVG